MGAVRESRRVWVMATVVAVLVVAGVVALFRPPGATPPRRGVMVKPTVEIPPSGASALDERAVFKDPGPLFLPTRWNCVPPKMEGNEPKGEFAGYEAKYAFSVNDLNLNLPPATQVPKSPAEAVVRNQPGNPFMGLGRADVQVSQVPARWAFVEVLASPGGRRVLAQPLSDPAAMKAASQLLRDGSWRPMEFLAAVSPDGLVGRIAPVLRPDEGSGDPFLQLPGESLAMLENYLAEKLRLGDRLPPGFYRILIGP